MDDLKCEDCGTTDNVTETVCPFAQDVHNKEIPAVLCDKCCSERAADI